MFLEESLSRCPGVNLTMPQLMVEYLKDALHGAPTGPAGSLRGAALLLGCVRPPREYTVALSEAMHLLHNHMLIVMVGSSVGERGFLEKVGFRAWKCTWETF
jgi:hypothetical protein